MQNTQNMQKMQNMQNMQNGHNAQNMQDVQNILRQKIFSFSKNFLLKKCFPSKIISPLFLLLLKNILLFHNILLLYHLPFSSPPKEYLSSTNNSLLFLPCSSSHNVVKSKVHCPHSISRICSVQELGLVFFSSKNDNMLSSAKKLMYFWCAQCS